MKITGYYSKLKRIWNIFTRIMNKKKWRGWKFGGWKSPIFIPHYP